jgi:hypothetical protein
MKSHVSPYRNRRAVLATKHHKEKAISRPLQEAIGLSVFVPADLDTDLLGTFSGEVERDGTPSNVVVRKARFGMAAAGVALGVASEGSFRPHAELSFVVGCHELMAFVDDDVGLVVVEDLFTLDTNFGNAKARDTAGMFEFLDRAKFPTHGLIVVPNDRIKVGHDDRIRLVLENVPDQQVFKGISDLAKLDQVVRRCAAMSSDGFAHVETDMRAHFNPTRMRTINALAVQLGQRLATPCPKCGAPGWGRLSATWEMPVDGAPFVARETVGCAGCGHRQESPSGPDFDQRHAAND